MTAPAGSPDDAEQPSGGPALPADRGGAGAAAFRMVVWWLLVIAAAATVVAAIFFWVYVFVPAIIMIVLYGLLLSSNLMARRSPMPTTKATAAHHDKPEFAAATTDAAASRHETPPADDEDEHRRWRALERERERQEDARREVDKASLKVALPIAGGLVVIAVILASVVFHWRIAAIGALFIFCYMLLVGGPFWLLTIHEETPAVHGQRDGTGADRKS